MEIFIQRKSVIKSIIEKSIIKSIVYT